MAKCHRPNEGDLSTTIIGPTLYAFESIRQWLRPEDIKMVVETTRQDRSKRGRRDYAILMLLSSYGLRAGEITSLRLEDMDWQGDVVRIPPLQDRRALRTTFGARRRTRHPGLSPEGPAKDSRRARSFILDHAPYRPFQCGSCLYWLVRHRLTAAGVNRPGKQGPACLSVTRERSACCGRLCPPKRSVTFWPSIRKFHDRLS